MQVKGNLQIVLLLLAILSSNAYYVHSTSDMKYNTASYTTYYSYDLPQKKSNSTIQTPFYVLSSSVTIQSTSSSKTSVDLAIMPEKMLSYVGYDERGVRQYCCTEYGVRNSYCKDVGSFVIKEIANNTYVTHHATDLDDGDVISLQLAITSDVPHSVIVAFCEKSYSSFSYNRVDHISSPAGEFPAGYSLLMVTLPLLFVVYCVLYFFWVKVMQPEKKKVYYRLFSILCLLHIGEYLLLSVFVFYYQFTGNYHSGVSYFFLLVILLLRSCQLCCYLDLTFGYDLVKVVEPSKWCVILYFALYVLLMISAPFLTLTEDLSQLKIILQFNKMSILAAVLFAVFFFVLLNNTFSHLLKKNQFTAADVLRQYRSAMIISLIVFALVCAVHLTYDLKGFVQSVQQKWLFNQNMWDLVKLLTIILCVRAWKSQFNPNRMK